MFSQLKFMFLQFKQNKKSTAAVVNGLFSKRQGGRKPEEELRREEGSAGRRKDWGVSSLNPVSTRVQRLQNRAYSTGSLTGQRTVCAGSLH